GGCNRVRVLCIVDWSWQPVGVAGRNRFGLGRSSSIGCRLAGDGLGEVPGQLFMREVCLSGGGVGQAWRGVLCARLGVLPDASASLRHLSLSLSLLAGQRFSRVLIRRGLRCCPLGEGGLLGGVA